MHQDTLPVTTALTARDLNMVIWSLMAFVEAGGGAPSAFDANVPESYLVLRNSLFNMVYPIGITVEFDSNSTGNPNTYWPWSSWVEDISGRVSISRLPTDPTNTRKSVGQTGGTSVVTLASANMPPHVHAMGNDGGPVVESGTGTSFVAIGGYNPALSTGSTGGSAGLAQPFSVLNPYIVRSKWTRIG